MDSLSIGETTVLMVVGPRHHAGEPFDVAEELASRHDLQGGLGLCVMVYPRHAMGLVSKGIFREEPGGLFSLTEEGEAFWKSCVGGGWKAARQGAGVRWKDAN